MSACEKACHSSYYVSIDFVPFAKCIEVQKPDFWNYEQRAKKHSTHPAVRIVAHCCRKNESKMHTFCRNNRTKREKKKKKKQRNERNGKCGTNKQRHCKIQPEKLMLCNFQHVKPQSDMKAFRFMTKVDAKLSMFDLFIEVPFGCCFFFLLLGC